MATMTEAQRKVRTAPMSELTKARLALSRMNKNLERLPDKWAKQEAEQKAKIEAQRKLVEALERTAN